MRGIRVGRAFVGIVAMVVATGACKEEGKTGGPGTEPSAGAAASASPAAKQAVPRLPPLPLAPIARRDALAAIYRAAPDRRLLRAFDEVERVVTGKPPVAPATARFEKDAWIVTAGERELARWSEFPSFDEALASVTKHAEGLARGWKLAGPIPRETDALPFDDQAFATMAAAQATWAKAPTRAALHDAARALTSLSLGVSDAMGLGDVLPARALAVVAIDKALGGPTRSLESSLGIALGYRTSAEKIAAPLPKTDPVRQYLLDEPALAAAARAPNAPAMTRYLYERRLVLKYDRTEEAVFRPAAFPDGDRRLPVLALRTDHTEFADAREVMRLFGAVTLLETGIAAGAADAIAAKKALESLPPDPRMTVLLLEKLLATTRGGTLARFDKDLPSVTSDRGPFFDAEIHQSYLKSFMYSAQEAAFRFELDSYASAPAAKALVEAIAPSPSEEARAFKEWALVLAGIAEGDDPMAALPRVDAAGPFGYYPRGRLVYEVQHGTHVGDVFARQATRRLAPFVDTRPKTLDAFGDIAWDSLDDVRIGERFNRTAADAGSQFVAARYWWAKRTKDEAALRALWTDETLALDDRFDALARLEKLGKVPTAQADAEIDRALAKTDNWRGRSSAASHLTHRGRYEHARKIARDWIARHENDPGLEVVDARVCIAESFEKEKRWSDMLEAITPAIPSWQQTAMELAAMAQARLGRRAEALDLADKVLERYPTAGSMNLGAAVRWIFRDYDGAAAFFAKPPKAVRIRNRDWQDFGGAFITAFSGAPDDAKKAIDALLRAGINVDSVMQMSWHARDHHEPELAFTLVTHPRPPVERRFQIGRLVNGYTMMRAWKGEAAAADWLRPHVKPDEGVVLAGLAVELGEEPLLWSVVGESGSLDDREKLWAMRALSVRRTPSLRAKLDEVRAHYEATADSKSHASVLGRYVAGLADEAAVSALVRDPKTSAEVAFAMAARAEGEGRYDDANDFYRTATETDGAAGKEVAQAARTLSRWKAGGVPLAKVGEIPFPRDADPKP